VLTAATGNASRWLIAKDVRIAISVAPRRLDAPAITLKKSVWGEALGELGPAADQAKAHKCEVED